IECPLPPKSQLELSRDPPNSSFIKAGESLTIVCEQQCENCASITKNLHCAPNSNMTFSLQGDNPHCF
ncbi:sushi, von Willebrand factor type A, EGF and pentraxin domain-containing protein 1, partial [Biomphalaria glabrata]